MDKSLDFLTWYFKTERVLMQRTCLTLQDVGFEREEVIGFYNEGMTSEELVDYLITKYNLSERIEY